MRSQIRLTRRAALATLGAGAILGLGYALRDILSPPPSTVRLRLTDDGGMMGVGPTDMSRYMEMFSRHNELTRTVEEVPGVFGPRRNRIHQTLRRNFKPTCQACTPTSKRALRSCA
jgi:hypothetical protein